MINFKAIPTLFMQRFFTRFFFEKSGNSLTIVRILALGLTLSLGANLSGCDATNTEQQTDINVHLKRGAAYQKQGQFRAAIIEARNAIQKDSTNIEGHVLLASIYNELGQSKSAITELTSFEGNKNSGYVFELTKAYLQKQKYKSALDLLNNHPEFASQQSKRFALYTAEAYAGLKQEDKAEAIYRKLLKSNATDADAKLGLARLEGLRGNIDKTEALVDQILADQPNHPDALILKARVALNQKRLDAAEALLTDALATLPATDIVTPTRSSVLRVLSEILTRQGRSAEALVYSRILADAFPGAQEIETKLKDAIKAYRDGDLDQAEFRLVDILKQVPGHEFSGTLLGIVNYLQGDMEGAEQYFEAHLDEETADPLVKQTFALTQLRLNQPQKVIDLIGEEAQTTTNPDILALYGIAAISVPADDTETREKGVAALNKALQLQPEKSRLHLILARHYNAGPTPDRDRALKEVETAFTNSPEDPYVQSALAQQLLAMDREKQAEAHIQDVVKRFGDQASSQLLAGTFYLNTNAPKTARNHFTRAIQLDSGYIRAYLGLAESALALKQWQTALDNYNKVIQLDPEQIKAYKGIITVYELQKSSEEGLKRVIALANSASGATAPRAVLAEYYARHGDTASALKHFETIKDSSDKNYINRLGGKIYLEKGRRLFVQKDFNGARQALVTTLEYVPNNVHVLTLLTHIEIEAEQYAEAQKIINQIAGLGSATPLADTLSGELAMAQGQYKKAIDTLRRAWSNNASDVIASKLYSALKKSSMEKESAAFLDQWQAAIPGSLQAKTTRANLLQTQGKFKESAKLYEEVLTKLPKSVITLNNLAWTYDQLGDKRAMDTAKRAYELAPTLAGVVDTYGWILVQNNQFENGIQLLEKAAALAPENEEIQQHLESAKKSQ